METVTSWFSIRTDKCSGRMYSLGYRNITHREEFLFPCGFVRHAKQPVCYRNVILHFSSSVCQAWSSLLRVIHFDCLYLRWWSAAEHLATRARLFFSARNEHFSRFEIVYQGFLIFPRLAVFDGYSPLSMSRVSTIPYVKEHRGTAGGAPLVAPLLRY